MFTTDTIGKSKNVTVKTAVAILVLLFIVVLGPGLLNFGTGQALAHDDRGDRWNSKRHPKVTNCSQTSKAALTACKNSASSDYWLGIGACDNLSDRQEKQDCLDEARSSLKDDYATCKEQFQARQEVCGELGQGPYDPDISPENFVSDPKGNHYFPLISGKKYTYKSKDQTIEVTVGDTTTIAGVTCRVVTDKVYDGEVTDGDLVEDTIDWFAQDNDGNVWYFGETTIAYEYDENGNPTASTEGSWMTGVDEAKPGIIMYAAPEDHLNQLYRQEFLLGTAEDLGKVIEIVNDLPSLPNGVFLPDGVVGPYLHTQDSTPLDVPAVIEDKYYAPGVGLVLTVEPEATEALINITP
jgi:hypothetical protein